MAHRGTWVARVGLAILLIAVAATGGHAQNEKPTPQQTAAIRACADKNQDDVTEAERQCLFNLVASPCQTMPEGQSNLGMADCFRLETAIWDGLLNDNFRRLRELLDDKQAAQARDMQKAWIAARDATCAFYDVKVHGSMAIPMAAACLARETARRALLLRAFTGL
jgi:uncharacterized protein YecT (DUF1311 family)